ncbi:CapA family protein [Desulforhopalus sp. 52FAK]
MNERIKFAAVGDISLGDFPITLGFGVRSLFEENKNFGFNDGVISIFKEADVCFGNLETVISDINYRPNDLISAQMRGTAAMAELLSASGLNFLSVANNHMMQHGPEAFKDTVSVLASLNISPVGLLSKKGEIIANYQEIYGKMFCFIGYSMRPEKYNKPVLYSAGSKEVILADIEKYKSGCDYLILSLHWGDEFVDFPSPTQVSIAHDFINAGAKIIIGHHPHIIQGIERYNGGVIAYSLGNFVFDFWQKRLRESMILVITLNGDDVEDLSIIPVRINNCYMPELLEGEDANTLLKKYHKLCDHPALKLKSVDKDLVSFNSSKYDRQVRWRLIENKIQNRLFFLKNLHKYPEGIVRQSLDKFITGRLSR